MQLSTVQPGKSVGIGKSGRKVTARSNNRRPSVSPNIWQNAWQNKNSSRTLNAAASISSSLPTKRDMETWMSKAWNLSTMTLGSCAWTTWQSKQSGESIMGASQMKSSIGIRTTSHGTQTKRTQINMPSKGWDESTYPFQNFNVCPVQDWERISNSTPLFVMKVITHPCWDYGSSMAVKMVPDSLHFMPLVHHFWHWLVCYWLHSHLDTVNVFVNAQKYCVLVAPYRLMKQWKMEWQHFNDRYQCTCKLEHRRSLLNHCHEMPHLVIISWLGHNS